MDKKSASIETKALANRTIRFTVSDETVDHAGDSMVASGCSFETFQKNPLFMGFHDYHNLPFGIPKAWGIDSRGKKVWMDVYFPTVEELATDPANSSEHVKLIDSVYNMYKMGMLNAVSVGFNILDYDFVDGVRRITKWELLEVSAVPIPCNPNALVEAKSFADDQTISKLERAFNMEEKAGRRFSTQTVNDHAMIHEAMNKCHSDYMAKCNQLHKEYKAEMEEHLGKLKDFMASSEPEQEEQEEEKPKAINLDIVAKNLRSVGDSK